MSGIKIESVEQLDLVVKDPGELAVGLAAWQALQVFPDRQFEIIFEPGYIQNQDTGVGTRPDFSIQEVGLHVFEPVILMLEATQGINLDSTHKKKQAAAIRSWLDDEGDQRRGYIQTSARLNPETNEDMIVSAIENPQDCEAIQADILMLLADPDLELEPRPKSHQSLPYRQAEIHDTTPLSGGLPWSRSGSH